MKPVVVVKVHGSTSFHMVLLYFSKNNNLLVLDNLSWKILPLNKRKDLKFFYAFNDKFSYILKNKKLVKEEKTRRMEVILLNNIAHSKKIH